MTQCYECLLHNWEKQNLDPSTHMKSWASCASLHLIFEWGGNGRISSSLADKTVVLALGRDPASKEKVENDRGRREMVSSGLCAHA